MTPLAAAGWSSGGSLRLPIHHHTGPWCKLRNSKLQFPGAQHTKPLNSLEPITGPPRLVQCSLAALIKMDWPNYGARYVQSAGERARGWSTDGRTGLCCCGKRMHGAIAALDRPARSFLPRELIFKAFAMSRVANYSLFVGICIDRKN